MKPETRKRLWIFATVASLWLCSLFVYQVIVADPRSNLRTAFLLEFYVCSAAVILAIAALILHTKKSLKGLILSLILLGLALTCLLNTHLGTKPPNTIKTEVEDIGGGIGSMQLQLSDNGDGDFGIVVTTKQEDADKIRSVSIHVSYRDLLGRYISHKEFDVRCDKPLTNWGWRFPTCFSGKDLGVLIAVTTMDGKVHEKSVQVKTPEKPFWSR